MRLKREYVSIEMTRCLDSCQIFIYTGTGGPKAEVGGGTALQVRASPGGRTLGRLRPWREVADERREEVLLVLGMVRNTQLQATRTSRAGQSIWSSLNHTCTYTLVYACRSYEWPHVINCV